MHFLRISTAIWILHILSLSQVAADNDDHLFDLEYTRPEEDIDQMYLWVTISARKRFVEVAWENAPAEEGDNILVTTKKPVSFEKVRLAVGTPLAKFGSAEGSDFVPFGGFTTTRGPYDMDSEEGSGFGGTTKPPPPREYWISNNGLNDIVAAIKPNSSTDRFNTGVPFNYGLSRNVTLYTACYGFWASYINSTGAILATACIRAYPRWMHDLRSVVNGLRLRDLFIPGTHDSGSYRPNFDPTRRETIVTKYALTQDDDIRGQLMHGVRYLDIRVGYYKNTAELFFINHGITKQRPLWEIIEQVKNFVLETNEIVIFGVKEFPVGFGKNLSVHRLLVQYLQDQFGDLNVHPSATWQATMQDLWSRRQNVILAYDKSEIVHEFPDTLFRSVEQRWGNVQDYPRLENHLRAVNTYDVSRLSSRPVADMAELTPDAWSVILDKFGGLRKMADNINWRITELYRDELGHNANIVAVDFIRSASLMETAIEWNKRKVIY